MQHLELLYTLIAAAGFAQLASSQPALPQPLAQKNYNRTGCNKVAGTWSLVSNIITAANGTSRPAFGANPVGILIFAPTLYFSLLVSIDPADIPRFPSDTDRTSGTAAENAAVIADTFGQIGTYTVDDKGEYQGEIVISSTFPNWDGLHWTTSTINETVSNDGRYMHETLRAAGSAETLTILWERVDEAKGTGGRICNSVYER